MGKILSEDFVKKSVIRWLSRKGFGRNLELKASREKGVDIRVRHNRYPRYFFVEAKGEPDPKKVKRLSIRQGQSFMGALAQIITRMKSKADYKYAIAFPESYFEIAARRTPWIVCKKLGLEILLVNKSGKVDEITWKDLKHWTNYLK